MEKPFFSKLYWQEYTHLVHVSRYKTHLNKDVSSGEENE